MSASSEKEALPGSDVKVNSHDSEADSLRDESLEFTPKEFRRVRRIVDWRILPYLSLLYLLSTSSPSSLTRYVLIPSGFAGPGFLDRVCWPQSRYYLMSSVLTGAAG